MSSESLQKSVIACQPFKNGVATIICSGCLRLMAFPSGASKVRCAGCNTITSGFKINCTSCREPLKIHLKDKESKCPSCGYVFTPLTTFKLPVPKAAAASSAQNIISVKLLADSNLSPQAKEGTVVKLNISKPLSANMRDWETRLGVATLAHADFLCKGEALDAGLTPKQLNLENGMTITCSANKKNESQAGGHVFRPTQFNQPTNCAYCKKFIWGIYNQGKWCVKCTAPVHHRCAAMFTQMCEATLRESIGIAHTQFGDDCDPEEPEEGFLIQKEDVAEWESLLSETVCPENDAATMSLFDKFDDFSEEDIAAMWQKYDGDGSGGLDLNELRALVFDLLGISGAKRNDAVISDTVQRVMKAMDTSRDGVIQWEEFYSFYKARQDSSFLLTIQGDITREQINELWYHYDCDNSGSLDSTEVLRLLRDCAHLHKGDKKEALQQYRGQLSSLFTPGKKVTWEEFCSILLPIIQSSLDEEYEEEEEEDDL